MIVYSTSVTTTYDQAECARLMVIPAGNDLLWWSFSVLGGLSGDAARKWKKSLEGRRAKWATHGRLRGSRMVAALGGTPSSASASK